MPDEFGSEITSVEDVLRHMGQIFIGNHYFRLYQRHCTASLSHNLQVICTHLTDIAYVERSEGPINGYIYHRNLCIYHHKELTVLTEDLPTVLINALFYSALMTTKAKSVAIATLLCPQNVLGCSIDILTLSGPEREASGILFINHTFMMTPDFLYMRPLSLVPIL